MIPTRGAVRSAAVLAALLLAACGDRPPPAPEFRQDRAWSHLVRQISFGPRYADNPGHRRQLAWMVEELEFRADTVIRQEFTAADSAGRPLKMTNLVARFRPELADRVLLVANWDTRRRADGSPEPLDRKYPVPGANLNASGVAVLMEMAQMFRDQPPPVGIDLLLADGDDYSREVQMRGTKHFIQSMPGYRPRYAVVLQAVADVEAKFPMDAGSAAEPARRMWDAAKRLRYDSVFVAETAAAAPNQGPLLTAAGIPTVVVTDREYGPLNMRWHAVADLPPVLSRETLGLVGRTLVATIYAETPAEVR
ncbi:M28 family peptidase [Longimicrobium sp.]|uniref:M28 family peptidase n=1 Tax=Longimicrobium sp. TaxID=2029185 RepID=UPI003B3AAB78